MRRDEPKNVVREWMLVEAYTAAKEKDDFGLTQELFALTSAPYDEVRGLYSYVEFRMLTRALDCEPMK